MDPWSPARPLDGTRPWIHPDAEVVGPASPDALVDVTLILRPEERVSDHPAVRRRDEVDGALLHERRALTLEELAALHAPHPSHVQQVAAYARHHGLEVLEASDARHDVVVRGPVRAVDAAFGLEQRLVAYRGREYRSHEGEVHLPEEVADVVEAVLGLDEFPRMRPHGGGGGGAGGLSVADLARIYDFPPAGPSLPRVAVLESGGYHPSDLDAFFRADGTPPPTIRDVNIRDASGAPAPNHPLDVDLLAALVPVWKADGAFEDVMAAARNALEAKGALPPDPKQAAAAVMRVVGDFEATAEVTMDLQILGGLAPGAPLDVYFTALSPDGWRRALYAMMGAPYPGDQAQPLPAVLSVSWGGSESGWGGVRSVRTVHQALEAAARRGITICCSSGDWGSQNSKAPSRPAHQVNFPASSPSVVACGGTAITSRGEVVWSEPFLGARMASGGGMSGLFPRPAYQRGLETPVPVDTWIAGGASSFDGRWLPDVAANAAFSSGVKTVLGGEPFLGGGTSAATPIWAALLARISGALGRPLGAVNSALYATKGGLASIRSGDNDVSGTGTQVYPAAPGWDPCTGLGVPRGSELLRALKQAR